MRGVASKFVEIQTRTMLPSRLSVGTIYCIMDEGVMMINHGNITAQYPREVLDTVDGVLQVGNGGTGGSTKEAARENLEAEWTGNKTKKVEKADLVSDDKYPTEKAVRTAIDEAVYVYEHKQEIAAKTWVIQHNAGEKYVLVLALNENNEEIVGLEDWDASDEKKLWIQFSEALKGKAYVY